MKIVGEVRCVGGGGGRRGDNTSLHARVKSPQGELLCLIIVVVSAMLPIVCSLVMKFRKH